MQIGIRRYRGMFKMKLFCSCLCLLLAPGVVALDNGPQVLGCDYKTDGVQGTDICLIVGSGMNQGVSWVLFELQGRRYRYIESESDSIEVLDKRNQLLRTQSMTRATGQCRPGGRDAEIYQFDNGDRICLYWPQ